MLFSYLLDAELIFGFDIAFGMNLKPQSHLSYGWPWTTILGNPWRILDSLYKYCTVTLVIRDGS